MDEQTVTSAAAEAASYTLQELQEASQNLFGCGAEVLDGAFYGKDLTKRYTVDEAKSLVDAFLTKEVH